MARYLSRFYNFLPPIHPMTITARNGMSVFAPHFVEPTFKKDKIKALYETGEIEQLSLVPAKPPFAYQTCSRFQDARVSKFINIIMECGKKQLARKLVEKAFENIKRIQIERYHLETDPAEKQKIELEPIVIFHRAIENIRPVLELTPIRRGGIKYQVPVALRDSRSYFLGMKWMMEASIDKDSKIRFHDQLAWELLDAANNRGRVVKRKQELHKQCEANRAYAHYRWL